MPTFDVMHIKTLYGKYVVTLLTAIHLIGVFNLYIPFLEYKVNYEYISEVLCINKTNEKLDCNGKCYLKKEIEKAAKESAEEQKSTSSQEVIECLLQTSSEFLTLRPFITTSDIRSINPQNTYKSLSSEISAPPPKVLI